MQRAEKYARKRRTIAQKTDEICSSLLVPFLYKVTNEKGHVPSLDAPILEWAEVPREIDPVRGGALRDGSARGYRKHIQVEAFLHVVKEVLLLDTTTTTTTAIRPMIADLGSGAGNLSLPLAWWLRHQCDIVAVDINDYALQRLVSRARAAGLGNVAIQNDDLMELLPRKHCADEYPIRLDDVSKSKRSFNDWSAIVSLHACGAASDLAMEVAVGHSLPFIISPCCIGKISNRRRKDRMPSISSERSAAPEDITYPRSISLGELVDDGAYKLIASAADYCVVGEINTGTEEQNASSEEWTRRNRGRLAKRIIESDRLQWAQERGYYVRLLELPRIGPVYPKRELLIGAKRGSDEAGRIARLSTSILYFSIEDR